MKKYMYKGKEISKRKANLMVIGACTGMVGAAFGIWVLVTCLSMIFQIVGA